MPALECIFEVVVDEQVRMRLGQNRLERFNLGHEAFCVDWRFFPVQSQFDGDLGDLANNANNAYNTKRVSHMFVNLREFDGVAKPGHLKWGKAGSAQTTSLNRQTPKTADLI
jgi:hypothetical protein